VEQRQDAEVAVRARDAPGGDDVRGVGKEIWSSGTTGAPGGNRSMVESDAMIRRGPASATIGAISRSL
jgi:hypothetical protein